jgi:hypothetical protein
MRRKTFIYLFIFPFGWVNYIFHTLSNWLSSNFLWVHHEVLFKMGCEFFSSCIFWVVPTCNHMAKTAQGLKDRVLIFFYKLPVKILCSHLFLILVFLIILHDVIFNAAAWMQIWRIWNFPKKFISSIVLEVSRMTPLKNKILPHSYLRWSLSHMWSTLFRSDEQKTQK